MLRAGVTAVRRQWRCRGRQCPVAVEHECHDLLAAVPRFGRQPHVRELACLFHRRNAIPRSGACWVCGAADESTRRSPATRR
eukprot:11752310-Alexandrium_andersonii.AAC.1